jgi:hypothetical protein
MNPKEERSFTMTPEITRLQTEAAIASERATVAKSKAQIATLEFQRSTLSPSGVGGEGNFVVNCLVVLLIGACCVWSSIHDDQSSQAERLDARAESTHVKATATTQSE